MMFWDGEEAIPERDSLPGSCQIDIKVLFRMCGLDQP